MGLTSSTGSCFPMLIPQRLKSRWTECWQTISLCWGSRQELVTALARGLPKYLLTTESSHVAETPRAVASLLCWKHGILRASPPSAPALQHPCQCGKTNSKSCCSTPAARGCSTSPSFLSVIQLPDLNKSPLSRCLQRIQPLPLRSFCWVSEIWGCWFFSKVS